MGVILFEAQDPDHALEACPRYWQDYIRSFGAANGNDLGAARARMVKCDLKNNWGGRMKTSGHCFSVVFDTEGQRDWFLLRWM